MGCTRIFVFIFLSCFIGWLLCDIDPNKQQWELLALLYLVIGVIVEVGINWNDYETGRILHFKSSGNYSLELFDRFGTSFFG